MLNIRDKIKFKKIAIVGIVSVITASTVATIVHASSIDIDKKQMQEQAIEQKVEQEMLVITGKCFERGLVIETAGPDGEVVKCLCPLIITEAELNQGLDWLEEAAAEADAERNAA